MDHAGAKSGTIVGSGLTGGGYNGSVSGNTGGSGRRVGVGNGVKGYVEIGIVRGPGTLEVGEETGTEEFRVELEWPDEDAPVVVPDELGAVLEGGHIVKGAEVVSEGVEGGALPEDEGADEEGDEDK